MSKLTRAIRRHLFADDERYAATLQEWPRLGVIVGQNPSSDESQKGWKSILPTHFMHGEAGHFVEAGHYVIQFDLIYFETIGASGVKK